MKKYFVSDWLIAELKTKGFSQKPFAHGKYIHQQVIDWFRIDHGYRIVHMHDLNVEAFGYCLFSNEPIKLSSHKNYYKALEAAIRQVGEHLRTIE